MSDQFYLTSPHSWVGSTVMFHAINGKGYVTDLAKAHVYTKAEAQKMLDDERLRISNNEELPLCAERIKTLTTIRVDYQHVKLEYPEHKDSNNRYVLYKEGVWDGNDLGFASELRYNYDYEKAKVFTEDDLSQLNLEGWVAVPKTHADSISRQTFQWRNINKRKMMTSAGLRGYRSPRPSKSSGKIRWNCPSCGRINWQHHPYDFMGCGNIDCDEWSL